MMSGYWGQKHAADSLNLVVWEREYLLFDHVLFAILYTSMYMYTNSKLAEFNDIIRLQCANSVMQQSASTPYAHNTLYASDKVNDCVCVQAVRMLSNLKIHASHRVLKFNLSKTLPRTSS